MRIVTALAASLIALLLSSCGPTLYTARIMPAARRVSEAREAGAANFAPYEFYYAEAHLDKAREEAGESNWQDARDHARTAVEYATKAREMAQRVRVEMGR